MNFQSADDRDDSAAGEASGGVRASEAFLIAAPERQTVPLVFASPHSGRDYPDDFLAASRLDSTALRQSEDAFVDELFADVVELGAPLIAARFPRAYVDVNREPLELDPSMFTDRLPANANVGSPRVAAGLGTIARIVSSGQEIYDGPLSVADAEARIDACYRPYHRALAALVERTLARFSGCLVVDCHSMPSGTGDGSAESDRSDLVIGDCWGSSCRAAVADAVESAAAASGFRTRRNVPYAGGYTTRHYGRPAEGIQAIQIEIRRDLYMDERTVTRSPAMDDVRYRLGAMVRRICDDAEALLTTS